MSADYFVLCNNFIYLRWIPASIHYIIWRILETFQYFLPSKQCVNTAFWNLKCCQYYVEYPVPESSICINENTNVFSCCSPLNSHDLEEPNLGCLISNDSCSQARAHCKIMSDLEVCRLHLQLLRHVLFSPSAFEHQFKKETKTW